jgi:hypothetical protein
MTRTAAAPNFLVLFVALCLSIPITLASAFNYDLNPAFLLAPIVIYAVFVQSDKRIGILFFVTALGGITSCLIANWVQPDGLLARHFLGLLLMLISVSFLFLGRWLNRADVISAIRALAVLSSIFGLALSLRVILLMEPVRIQIEPQGYAALNAKFLGLDVFGTFGVLSLAQLFCIQACLCCALILDNGASRTLRLFATLGLSSLLFLIIGSDARSAQIGMGLALFVLIAWMAFKPGLRSALLAVVVASVAAAGATYVRGSHGGQSRLVSSIEILDHAATESTNGVSASPEGTAFAKGDSAVSTVSNGRIDLLKSAIADITLSPLFGQGFGPFGRFASEKPKDEILASSSTHIYFLTALWKGGVLFAAPLFLMLVLLAHEIRKSRASFHNPRYFPIYLAVILSVVLSVTWDILMVPSAGSLAFFLAGLLSVPHKQQSNAGPISQ